MIENRNDMTLIHNNEVNNIAKYNLIHNIINPPKRAKTVNSHCFPILNVCMDNKKIKEKFKKVASYWTVDVVPPL